MKRHLSFENNIQGKQKSKLENGGPTNACWLFNHEQAACSRLVAAT